MNCFSLLASALLGWLLEIVARLHFAEKTFALHFFLQGAQGLIHIIVADDNLYDETFSIGWHTGMRRLYLLKLENGPISRVQSDA